MDLCWSPSLSSLASSLSPSVLSLSIFNLQKENITKVLWFLNFKKYEEGDRDAYKETYKQEVRDKVLISVGNC